MLNLFLHKYVWNICRWTLSNKHGPRLLPDFIIWVRRRMSYMYNIQTLLTLREHMGSPPMFWNCPCLFISEVFCVDFFSFFFVIALCFVPNVAPLCWVCLFPNVAPLCWVCLFPNVAPLCWVCLFPNVAPLCCLFVITRFPIHDFVTRLTWRVPLVEQDLLTLSEHLRLPPVFSGVRVARSFVLCVCFVDRCLSFCTVSFGNCVVCSSLIYGIWLPLWYLQALLVFSVS
jgi:hypothetical protein